MSPNKLDLFGWDMSKKYCAFENINRQKGGVQPQGVQGGSMLTGVPTDCNMHTEASARVWETAWAATLGGCQDVLFHCFCI